MLNNELGVGSQMVIRVHLEIPKASLYGIHELLPDCADIKHGVRTQPAVGIALCTLNS